MAESNPLIESVNNLQDLSNSLPTFTLRWNELQNHLDLIQKCIEARSKQLESKNGNALEAFLDPRSEIELLCQAMDGKGLRKFVITHLSDIEKIGEYAQLALKSAPDPAKIVLECIGGFYLQGNKAYTKKETHLVSVRQACIHVLEFFLSSGADVSESVSGDAEKTANLWRSRMINEGGIVGATKLDALGLLLFVSSYGVPSEFTRHDLYELIRLADPKEKAGVLKKSPFLIEKLPDIIQGLVEKKMLAAAVDMAVSLGLEDKFHPVFILKEFLRESKETTKSMRREGQGSGAAQKEASIKRLADLKLAFECMEKHDLDNEFASDKLKEEADMLEKQIKMAKRNADELGAVQEKPKTREGKRPRLGASVAKSAGLSVGNTDIRTGPLPGIVGPLSASNGVGSYGRHGEGTFNKSVARGPPSAAVQGLLGLSSSVLGQTAVMGQNLLGSGLPPHGQSLLGQSTPLHGTGQPSLYGFGDSLLGTDSWYGSSQFGNPAPTAYASYLR